MVKIDKSKKSPVVLSGKGAVKKKEMCVAFDKYPKNYSSPYNKKTNPFAFDFDSGIYGDEAVKEQLKKEQDNKCCFCENKDFDDVAYGDVEHYRPKAAFKNDDTEKAFKRPGYYWVAYDWENLLFSCQICNQRYKKNFFPLVKGAKRAVSRHDNLEPKEQTLLINPVVEDPSKYLGFRKEIIYNKSPKGSESIKYYGLDRDKLDDKRRKHLDEVRKNIFLSKIQLKSLTPKEIKEIMDILGARTRKELQDVIDTAILYVTSAAKKDAAFALMVRDNFKSLPKK